MSLVALIRNGMGDDAAGTGAEEDDFLYISNYYLMQSGRIDSGDFLVSQRAAGANMSIDVAPGRIFIPNAAYTANNDGETRFWAALNTAVYNIVVTANSSGNPRIDIVVVTMNTATAPDDEATNVIEMSVVAGTPAGSPVAPATPSNSIKIAEIAVANGAVSIVDANITDTRDYAFLDLNKAAVNYGDYLLFIDSSGNPFDAITLDASTNLNFYSTSGYTFNGAGTILTIGSSNTIGPRIVLGGGTSFAIRSTLGGDAEGTNNFVLTNVGSALNLITIVSTGATFTFNGAGTNLTIATTSTTGPRVTLGGATSMALVSTSTGDAEGTNRFLLKNVGGAFNLMNITSTGGAFTFTGAGIDLALATTNTTGPRVTLGGGTSYAIRSTSTGDAEGNNLLIITNVGGGSNAIIINSSNQVAIGTTAASVQFEVNHASAAVECRVNSTITGTLYGLYFGADAQLPYIGSRTNHAFRLVTNSVEVARFSATGYFSVQLDRQGGSSSSWQTQGTNNYQQQGVIQIGSIICDAGATVTVTLPRAYSQSCWAMACVTDSAAEYADISRTSATEIDVNAYDAGGARTNAIVNWIAIGII